MKKILVFSILALVAVSANAFTCKRWIDENGFERVKCEHSNTVMDSQIKMNQSSSIKDIVIDGPKDSTGQFRIHNRANGTTKSCVRMHGGYIECW